MSHDIHNLEVAASDLEAFALCLALGTLEAIRCGTWPAEAGIWTLARPNFSARLEQTGVPSEVLAIFRGADELSALEQLPGREEVEVQISKWIAILHSRLAALPEQSWHARWSDFNEPRPQGSGPSPYREGVWRAPLRSRLV
ncbi:MAG: hypothetical protein L0241_23715 [Planctomycetia bacterium]|nr:hypothetical protein [Planctomycetia bacterium]